VVLLNAAAAFVAAGRVADLDEGVRLAAATLDVGTPRDLLARLRAAKEANAAAVAARASEGAPA
jgi:anthranilate phosphoribosyltransferase